jgi:hypothetical protein
MSIFVVNFFVIQSKGQSRDPSIILIKNKNNSQYRAVAEMSSG